MFVEVIEYSVLPTIKDNVDIEEDYDSIRTDSSILEKFRTLKKEAKSSNRRVNKSKRPTVVGAPTGKLNRYLNQLFLKDKIIDKKTERVSFTSFLELNPKRMRVYEQETKHEVMVRQEFEVFTITDDIRNPLNLVLPFTVNLAPGLPISQEHTFDIVNQLKYLKMENLHQEIDRQLEALPKRYRRTEQKYSVFYRIKLFYVPYGRYPKKEVNLFKRLRTLEGDHQCLKFVAGFNVRKKFVTNKLQNYMKIVNVPYYDKFRTCKGIPFFHTTKTILQNMPVEVSLDTLFHSNLSNHINFVITFPSKTLIHFKYIDVSLMARLEKNREGQSPNYIERVIYFDSIEINKKQQMGTGNSKGDSIEILSCIELSRFRHTLNSIRATHFRVEYYIAFHLSQHSFRFDELILKEMVNFSQVRNDLKSSANLEKFNFRVVQQVCDTFDDTIMLPYAKVLFRPTHSKGITLTK